MKLSVLSKAQRLADNPGAINKSAFAWKGEIPAPFANHGMLRFKLSHPSLFSAIEVPAERALSNCILRFAGVFCTLSISADMTPYHRAIAPALIEIGLRAPEESLLLSWALIHRGLQKYAAALGPYLAARQGDVLLPISPLHVWALNEAAKAYIGCVDPDAKLAAYRDAADVVMVATNDENAAINEQFAPFVNIFIE